MLRTSHILRPMALIAAASAAVGAQGTPAIRLLNAPDASSKSILGAVTNVRQLPGGGVIVNDVLKRQLVMFDGTLSNATIIADSTANTSNAYGARPGVIIPFRGDSTLYVDVTGLGLLVIDPAGKLSRTMAIPRSQDAASIGTGYPGFDSQGRLVYRAMLRPQVMMNQGGGIVPPTIPDSSMIVAVNLSTRKLDTLGFFKISIPKTSINQSEGRISVTTELNPLPQVDEWAVLSDGSIAIVRGRDYHTDWINDDRSLTAAPKINYPWQRLSDEDKVAVIDSAKTAVEKARAAAQAGGPMGAGGPLAGMGMGGDIAAMAGMAGMQITMRGGAGGGGGGGEIMMNRGGGGGPGISVAPNMVSPSDLPDYRPPFIQGGVRGDEDGHLWVRTTLSNGIGLGPVYDVINRKGELVERVQIPAGRTIIGFGKGGVVYMLSRDGNASKLERTHFRTTP